MAGSSLPFIPLNMREGFKLEKSARVPTVDPKSNRGPCDLLRRYPNGTLDIESAAQSVIELVERIKDVNQGGPSHIPLNASEKALLTLVMPAEMVGVPKAVAQTQLRLSEDERALIQSRVSSHMKNMRNWNAGFGGGSTCGSTVAINKSKPKARYSSEYKNEGAESGPVRNPNSISSNGMITMAHGSYKFSPSVGAKLGDAVDHGVYYRSRRAKNWKKIGVGGDLQEARNIAGDHHDKKFVSKSHHLSSLEDWISKSKKDDDDDPRKKIERRVKKLNSGDPEIEDKKREAREELDKSRAQKERLDPKIVDQGGRVYDEEEKALDQRDMDLKKDVRKSSDEDQEEARRERVRAEARAGVARGERGARNLDIKGEYWDKKEAKRVVESSKDAKKSLPHLDSLSAFLEKSGIGGVPIVGRALTQPPERRLPIIGRRVEAASDAGGKKVATAAASGAASGMGSGRASESVDKSFVYTGNLPKDVIGVTNSGKHVHVDSHLSENRRGDWTGTDHRDASWIHDLHHINTKDDKHLERYHYHDQMSQVHARNVTKGDQRMDPKTPEAAYPEEQEEEYGA